MRKLIAAIAGSMLIMTFCASNLEVQAINVKERTDTKSDLH